MGESISDGRFNRHPPNEATCVLKGKCQDFEVSAVRVQVPVAPGTSPVHYAKCPSGQLSLAGKHIST